MKLYYIPASCSLSPHIVINELGLDVALIRVNHKSHTIEGGSDYRRVNPFGTVPVLELDDGTRLHEASVIVQYLADLKPERAMAPACGTMERYRLQEWLSFLGSEIHKGFSPLVYARLAGAYVETARPKLEARFAWINAQLASRAYLTGSAYTVADTYLFALTGWAQADWLTSYYKADIRLDALHHLRRWYEGIVSRPAVQQALAEEGLR